MPIFAWNTMHPAPGNPPHVSGLACTELAARREAELAMGEGSIARVASLEYEGGMFVTVHASLGIRPNAGRDVQWWNGISWE